MPRTVRLALLLLAAPIALGTVRDALAGRPLWELILGLAIPGLLLYGTATRRNWARLTFASLFVIGLPFAVVVFVRQGPSSSQAALAITFICLEAAGMVLLFLPQSAHWYHGRSAA
jgi:hypothetical protein